MSWFYHLVLSVTRAFLFVFYRKKVYGLEHFVKGGAILASNHASFYDPPVVSTSWPQPVHFLARASLFDHFFFGKLIRALCAHPVKGGVGDVAVFRMIGGLLKAENAVLLFPEGKRTETGDIGDIKPGVYLLASRANVPVVPVYLHGTYEVWNRSRKLPKLTGEISCVFGTAIHPSKFAHLERRAAETAFCDELKAALLRLNTWFQAGHIGSPP